jgi:hypothetical protein
MYRRQFVKRKWIKINYPKGISVKRKRDYPEISAETYL